MTVDDVKRTLVCFPARHVVAYVNCRLMPLQETVMGQWHGLGWSEMQLVNSYSFLYIKNLDLRIAIDQKKERIKNRCLKQVQMDLTFGMAKKFWYQFLDACTAHFVEFFFYCPTNAIYI